GRAADEGLMATPSVVVLPQPAALSQAGPAPLLALGRELVARVAAIAADGVLSLKIGNATVPARSDQPVQVGDVLRLQVADARPEQVVLRLVPPPAAQSAQPARVTFQVPLQELQPLLDEPAAEVPGAPVVVRVAQDEQGRPVLQLPSGGRLQMP